MAPHLDSAELVTRAMAAEESRKARIKRDRAENEARIREQVERDAPSYVTDEDEAERKRAELEEWGKENLSPEEMYPDHFPESTHEEEEVEVA